MLDVNGHLDVVDAYDHIVAEFPAIRAERRAYCDAVDGLVIANLPVKARSLLDVGCGDASRTEAIAQGGTIGDVVLLEPSSGMRTLIRRSRELWTSRIEDLNCAERAFDVITCLWNVLGQVPSPEKRLVALRNMRAMLSPGGILFLDVQNRYNARHYGWLKTASRLAYDWARPSAANGDVTVRWKSDSGPVTTYGHVFTGKEMRGLFGEAGLKIRQMHIVDYATGELRSSRFAGAMFFALGT